MVERKGQHEGKARKTGPFSSETIMPDIPDMQWCLPFRRQQAGVEFPAEASAKGATQVHATIQRTKLAITRRIDFRDSSTSR